MKIGYTSKNWMCFHKKYIIKGLFNSVFRYLERKFKNSIIKLREKEVVYHLSNFNSFIKLIN